MSKQASSAALFPAWKQEVNRRVAAHRSNKASSAVELKPTRDGRPAFGNRAALAAARVAERYAHAPSYSELLADEARNAMRAAEAAQQAADQAHAAVQYVLDGLEAAEAPELDQQPEVESNAPATQEVSAPENAPRESSANWQPATSGATGNEIAEPIYPNLIQFPRQIFATRRMRPRRAEGPLAIVEAEPQLSIFEVDPASVSTLPVPTTEETAAPVWMRGEQARVEFQPKTEVFEEPTPQAQQRSMKVAPLDRRLMALMIDASLTLAAFLALAMLTMSKAAHLPGLHTMELAALIGLAVVGAAYQELFLVMGGATPGMRYAGIALKTFEGTIPCREQRSRRIGALALSIAPLGLGLLWALFDEDGLMGHDRLSRTYLRKL